MTGQPLAVGTILLALAALLRIRRFSLLGPVFYYELVRTARHGRFFLLRCCYIGVLLVALSVLYSQTFGTGTVLEPFELSDADCRRDVLGSGTLDESISGRLDY